MQTGKRPVYEKPENFFALTYATYNLRELVREVVLRLAGKNGKPVPFIDRIHRLMHLWREGDVHKVDEYPDEHGLRRHELFKRLLQSLIELSEAGGDERALLESLSNHLGLKGAVKDDKQTALGLD